MHIILFRYSPRAVMLNNLSKENTLVIAPNSQVEKYDKFLSQGYTVPKILFLSDYSLPNIVLELRKIQNKEKIESITTLSEDDMSWTGFLHDHFVEDNTVSASNVLFKDKYLMRSILLGVVEQPYFRLLSNLSEYYLFWENANSDTAVIKPRFGAGSLDVITVDRDTEISSISERYISDNFLIEEFIAEKNMMTCDGYSIGNNIIRFFSHEYDELILESFESTKEIVCRTNSLYSLDKEFLWIVFQECRKVLSLFSVKGELTPFHFEWFYSLEDRKVYFCEVGKRFGGVSIPFLINYSFNIDILKEYWELLVSEEKRDVSKIKCIEQIPIPRVISSNYSPYRRGGIIKSMPSIEKFGWTKNTWIFVQKGMKTEKARTIIESLFVTEFISENEADYRDNLKNLRALTNMFEYEEE